MIIYNLGLSSLPIGIKVEILEDNDKFIYVFEVQPSQYKPHQYDTRYYVRLDGQTKPAPHYLVEALIKQISYPNLNGIIKFHPITLTNDEFTIPITIGIFNFSEIQNEELVSFRLFCTGGHFSKAHSLNMRLFQQKYLGDQEMVYDNFINVLHFGTPGTHHEIIIANQHELAKTDGKLILNLIFGGRTSPAKSSDYIINFKERISLHEPNLMLELCQENVLFAERKKILNSSSEDTLRGFSHR